MSRLPLPVTAYYRLSLALPIALPFACYAVMLPLELAGVPIPQPVTRTFSVLALAAIFGGLPYLGLGWLVLRRLRDRPAVSHRRAILVLPLAYSLIAGLFAFAMVWLLSAGTLAPIEPVKGGLLFAGFALGVGYGYVLLALALLPLARHLGWVEREQG